MNVFAPRASAFRAAFGCKPKVSIDLLSASLTLRSPTLALTVTNPRIWTGFSSSVLSRSKTTFKQAHELTNLEIACTTTASRLFGTSSDSSGLTMSVPRSGCEKPAFVVGHDSQKKMFYVELKDKSTSQQESVAKLEYEWVRPGLIDFYHTETPPAFQGKGIAKVLVLAGLDHFCEQDVLIRPTCTYVQKVLRDNLTSRYKEHVEESFLKSL